MANYLDSISSANRETGTISVHSSQRESVYNGTQSLGDYTTVSEDAFADIRNVLGRKQVTVKRYRLKKLV